MAAGAHRGQNCPDAALSRAEDVKGDRTSRNPGSCKHTPEHAATASSSPTLLVLHLLRLLLLLLLVVRLAVCGHPPSQLCVCTPGIPWAAVTQRSLWGQWPSWSGVWRRGGGGDLGFISWRGRLQMTCMRGKPCTLTWRAYSMCV